MWFASALLLVTFAAVHNAEELTKGQRAEPTTDDAGDSRQRQLKMMKMKYRNYYYRGDYYYYGKSSSKGK
jgi:hypothetical protein